MRSRARPSLVAVYTSCLLAVGSACGSAPAPAAPQTSTEDSTPISGSERLGWIQRAPSLSEAKSYTYALYVDNTRVALGSVTCDGTAGPGFSCSAPLPKLESGRRILELVAIDAAGIEGPRAAPLVVVVSAQT